MANRKQNPSRFSVDKTADAAFTRMQSITESIIKSSYSPWPFVVGLMLAAVFLSSAYACIIPGASDFNLHNNYAMSMFTRNFKHTVGYAGYHSLVAVLAKLTKLSAVLCSAWVMTAASIATIVIYRKILRTELAEQSSTKFAYFIDVIALFSAFIGTIVSGLSNFQYYRYVNAANVWHNPTLPFMRPFAIVMVWLYVLAIRNIKEGKSDTKLLVKFAICALLCAFAKPNGMLAVGPVMAIYTLVLLFKEIKLRFYPCLNLLISVIPTLLVMLVFSQIEMSAEGKFKMIFYIGTPYNISAVQELGYVISAALFGLLVLLFRKGKLFENELYGVTVLSIISAWFQLYFLAESGYRFSHGNLGWGYLFTLNLFLVVSFIPLLKEKSFKKITVLTTVYIAHFMFGLQYLTGILQGHSFWR